MTLEKLLNTLCEKGWEPFGINYYCYFNIRERIEIILWPFWWWEYILEKTPSLRELCSKESQLWQFVCENEMVNLEYDITESYKDSRHREQKWWYNWDRYLRWYDMYGYQYRLIESALLDEDKLEDFLLDNIKID